MPKYIFAYHGGGMPETPEEGERVMAAWGAWMQGLGKALVDGGNPVGMSRTVTASGTTNDGGPNPLSGYSIVEAESYEAACAMAGGCPILEAQNGAVEVAEIIAM